MFYVPSHLVNTKIKVALVGAGGTGSYLAQELVRLGKALNVLSPETKLEVTIFDDGVVTEANCIRQNFFSTMIGMSKADATVWTTNNLHGMNFIAKSEKATPKSLTAFNLIITAVDIPSIRYEIAQYFDKVVDTTSHYSMDRKLLWLDVGNTQASGNIVLGQFGNDKELPHICDLYDFSNLSDDAGLEKSCSAIESLQKQNLGVNAFCARIGGQLLTNLFLNGSIAYHGAYFDCNEMTVDPINIDKKTWEIYNYHPNKH